MQMLRESSWNQEKLLGAAQGHTIDDKAQLSDKFEKKGLDPDLARLAIQANSGD